jgi:hypothetical protein
MIFLHLLRGSTFNNISELYRACGIDIRYYPRSWYIGIRSGLASPLNLLEKKMYDMKSSKLKVNSPVFILGHWRSGTTLLHYILSNDQQFGFLTTQHVTFPHRYLSLTRHIEKIFHKIIPPQGRRFDAMKVGPLSPQEEEFALACSSKFSYYHRFYFPRNYRDFYRYLTFEGVESSEIASWKESVLGLYEKITYSSKNENMILLSKNPPFTGKIKYLLELFPDAKFVHIYRNPYTTFLSSVRLFRSLTNMLSLQTIQENMDYEESVFDSYTQLMEAFIAQKSLIPEKNIIEIKFEDLEKEPFREIERLYSDLNLTCSADAKERIKKYIASVQSYKKNSYLLSEELAEKIYSRLSFTIDRWGYSPDI